VLRFVRRLQGETAKTIITLTPPFDEAFPVEVCCLEHLSAVPPLAPPPCKCRGSHDGSPQTQCGERQAQVGREQADLHSSMATLWEKGSGKARPIALRDELGQRSATEGSLR